tara:strand:+ start:863 stop:1423 length:561 start_codon:yes stop_codon:yes gene_type:complete
MPRLAKAAALGIYLGMGSVRSAKLVSEHGEAMGTPRAITTVEKWITAGGWVEQARIFDERTGGADVSTLSAGVTAMNARHSAEARKLQEIAFEGLTAEGVDIPVDVKLRMYDKGTTIERLAEGQATTRREVAVLTYNNVMMPVLVLIRNTLDIEIEDDTRRQRVIGLLADGIKDITNTHLAAAEAD